MKLAEARRLALNLRKAEQEFDASWKARWRAIIASGVLVTIPLSGAVGFLAHRIWGDPVVSFLAGLACWMAVLTALVLTGPVLQRRAKRHQGMETMDARVLQACGELEGIAPDIAAVLERALDAYLHISRTADDPVWQSSGIPMTEPVRCAGEHLLALFDWGSRLSEVSGTVRRLADRPDGADVQSRYEEQLARLQAAAAAFERVEAKSARAYIALTAAAPGQSASAEDLAGLGTSFDALAEVLGGAVSGAGTANEQLTEPAVVRVGRAG